jgi:hypothetical protein
MTDEPSITPNASTSEPQVSIPFREFLETVHPSVTKTVTGLWRNQKYGGGGVPSAARPVMSTPDLRLHCQKCDGERTFRALNDDPNLKSEPATTTLFVGYRCGDCHERLKFFSLRIIKREGGGGSAYKFGEEPPFGVPVPKKLLRLFGSDSQNFLKGRQCENQGLGVGAFAYYRRVVENHKNEIFNEISRVCETLKAPRELVEQLRDAKNEVSFAGAVDKIKVGLPQGLLINGHNPLIALHTALSVGLHNDSDEECLGAANAVRLVLTDMVEKMSLLRQDNVELHKAVQLLISKKGDV